VVESPLVFLGQDEEQARITALDYYIRHYSLHPDTPWATLRGQIDEAYRRAGVNVASPDCYEGCVGRLMGASRR
jgi:hypothetical protein